MNVEIYETKEFLKALRAMKLVGGRKSKAADQVFVMRSSIGVIDNPFRSLRKTKHGESRIAGCVKYDLHEFCRLITIVGNGCIFLVFVGDHEDSEAWLESHRGLTIGAVDGKSLGKTKISDVESGVTINSDPDNWSGVLIERLSGELFERLLGDRPFREVQAVQRIKAGSSDIVIKACLVQVGDESLQAALYDILVLLNGGHIEEAENRTLHHLGDFKPLAELSAEELLELDMGDGTRKVELGSKEYSAWVSRFMETKHPFDWFLFMHPEQERHVAVDYSGPAKLSGVTGSGKTSIAVKRAIRLASEYTDKKLLVVSLNRALCEFISEIVDHACGSDQALRSRIEVASLFSICQALLQEFEPENAKLYSDITWGLEEHKDEVYREFYRCLSNVKDAEVLRPIHRLLTSQSIDAEKYISEEFDWIRSALARDQRSNYASISRQGRGYKILEQHRASILEGLAGWERKMSAVGVIDYMGLVTAVTRHMDKITPRYRCILVDEVQDFGSVELSILRKLVKPDRNDLFVCGDAAQSILPKHQSFDAAGIDVKGRSSRIFRNYRNSREILKVAHQVLTLNLSELHFEVGELEISDPELSYRSSAEPLLLEAKSLEIEIAAALRLLDANDEIAERRGTTHSGCIAIVGYSGFEVQQYGKDIGIPVLDGASKFLHGTRFLSDLEQTKGYEFDTMVIVNCAQGQLPPQGAPEQEVFRNASEFYVAMTRAKNQLILSFSGNVCAWLKTLNMSISLWSDVVDVNDLPKIGIPGFLQEFPDTEALDLRQLTGTEFIFTPYARGLDVDVQERLEEFVDGRGLLQARTQRRLKWRDIGSLIDDLDSGIGASVLGPVARDVVKTRLAEASLGLRPSIKPKPLRKKTSLTQATVTAEAPQDPKPPTHDSARPNGLEKLGLAARELMILHELHIRSARDLIDADDKILAKHLTMTVINALKEKARAEESRAASRVSASISLDDADFSERIISMFKKMGLNSFGDLAQLSQRDLWAQSQLGRVDVQRILRICRDHNVTLRDN
ncbi:MULTISPECIES: UvrD-helicase domain-containing protein [unclassified Bradyrhizobium]|uniref:UvrD-helicase domain-containing protein n=1 Tax=unclassified Bradyrhizobium TaxID=2631580 RepID=UPI0029161F29|nr:MULTISPECIES: UvrD-helicase domain-containing protein [unclassified Bradyrhizobium]